jgi:hypothetical protein
MQVIKMIGSVRLVAIFLEGEMRLKEHLTVILFLASILLTMIICTASAYPTFGVPPHCPETKICGGAPCEEWRDSDLCGVCTLNHIVMYCDDM